MIRLLTSFLLLIMTVCLLQGQYVSGFAAGNGKNPSFAGIEGDGSLRLAYQSFFPGGGYELNSYKLSYDVFIEPLHGGVGVAVSSDHSGGLLTDSRIKLAWSYHLRATRELYIFAGMSAGLIHRSFNSSRLVFPDQIDPVNGVILTGGETVNYPSSLFYDMGAGLTVLYRTSFFSFDASHLFRPDLSRSGVDGADLPRIFTLQAFSRQNLGKDEFYLVPYAELVSGGGDYMLAAGGALEYNSLGFSTLWMKSAAGNAIQASCSMKMERLTLNYSFRFRAGAGEPGVPFGLMHQAGIRLSLNIVDKRDLIKAINLPEL